MAIRFGSAASPRWYDLSLDRLDAFIEFQVAHGASSTELVLHAGEADEFTARVHVLERDWIAVARRFQSSELVCHAHAPLGPRFKLSRWQSHRVDLKEAFAPVLDAIGEFSANQPDPCVLVLHAAGGSIDDARSATASFLEWAVQRIDTTESGFAIELRKPIAVVPGGIDRDRQSLAAFVDDLSMERVGICWDVAHDWEGRSLSRDWMIRPEAEFLRHVNHVHLHGAGSYLGIEDVHFPLQSGAIPWQEMLSPLVDGGYDGAITIEARYRYAKELGEPWSVLAESYQLLNGWLGRNGVEAHP